MLNKTMLELVHFDLRHWPPGQSLSQEVPSNVFGPNTLNHLRSLLATNHRAQAIIRMAETQAWSTTLADELYDLLQQWLEHHGPSMKSPEKLPRRQTSNRHQH